MTMQASGSSEWDRVAAAYAQEQAQVEAEIAGRDWQAGRSLYQWQADLEGAPVVSAAEREAYTRARLDDDQRDQQALDEAFVAEWQAGRDLAQWGADLTTNPTAGDAEQLAYAMASSTDDHRWEQDTDDGW